MRERCTCSKLVAVVCDADGLAYVSSVAVAREQAQLCNRLSLKIGWSRAGGWLACVELEPCLAVSTVR